MGRWEPNARERLQRAALAMFSENGYESTTAAEIAERAGLGKSTFFRHFADKREVLFGGQEELHELVAAAIAGAPEGATPIDALRAAMDAASEIFDDERRMWSRQRQVVIASSRELVERELLKRAALTGVMTEALRKRGVPDKSAGIAAELGNLAFRTAFQRWIAPGCHSDFGSIAGEELTALQAAITALH